MPFYYAFDKPQASALSAAYKEKKGEGFFHFLPKEKLDFVSDLPTSNTDPTPVHWFRCVMSLEVHEWATEDATIQAAAEASAEFWTTDNLVFLQWLAEPTQTI